MQEDIAAPEPPLSYQQTSQIQTPTDPTALKSVLAWFDQFQTAPIPHALWLQCQLALIEGFTNAVRHAHVGLPETTPVVIEVSISNCTVDVRIWDQGPGFDLNAVLKTKLSTHSPHDEGGRGLKIMYLVADQLSYTPSDRGNCLHLHKTYA
ncbi:ATP-binding protein [Phormidium sp. FACHB-1136]|uniref:ATP-binding protein n=1 Tax=Phormidium sp. FACHB-1136 TaxID=2692848 RepID=UPI001689823D|nr:ATP-binding protein [Phormidium sp. FACHB-1136]MBD2424744.1 ATP-binding protein [Phormidium sp. FACHB-1136]